MTQTKQPPVNPARFNIALLFLVRSSDNTARGSVVLDVTSQGGSLVIAHREVSVAELDRLNGKVRIAFVLEERSVLEFRVYVDGRTSYIVADAPYVARIEGQFAADEQAATAGDLDAGALSLQAQIRAVLRLLSPHTVRDFDKKRFGRAGDGGYVCVDDFDGIDVALSLGINDEISWDRDVAARGLTVYQFDHTVNDPAPHDSRLIFEKSMIAAKTGPGTVSLEDLVRRHDKGHARPNIFLKMDIECGEWSVLNETSPQALSRFSQIACELHAFENLANAVWRQGMYQALRRLNQNYALVHVHGNNYSGFSNVGNVVFPNVIEATFVNRSIYEVYPTSEIFPGRHDIACNESVDDLFLGNFRF